MHNRLYKYGVTAIVIAAAVVLWRTFTAAALLYDTEGALVYDVSATSTAQAAVTSAASPVRLSIPALDINAPIREVGLNANGAMSAPSKYSEVAWYRKGTVPGNKGSAVLAGHLDNGLGLSGVFKNLKDIEEGDEIFVKDSRGDLRKFIVVDIRAFDYDDVDGNMIFAPEAGRSLLRLVTCGGKWLPEKKTYDRRLVATAELVK